MNIIIVGGGKVGSYLATLLGNRGYNVHIVESRKAVAQRLEEKLPEGSVVRGMGSSPDVLEEAGVLQADVIIAVTGDDEVNLVVAMLAKMEYGVNRVVARVNNPANAWMFDESMGVDIAVDQADIITKSVEEGLDMEDVFTIIRLGKDGHEIVQGEFARAPRWWASRLPSSRFPTAWSLLPSSMRATSSSPTVTPRLAPVTVWSPSRASRAGTS